MKLPKNSETLLSKPVLPISVIIPFYNCGTDLVAAVQSVLLNTSAIPAEVFLVDDCSTDNSLEIAKNLSLEFPVIKVLRTKRNSGAASARYIALLESKQPWSAFLDADDELSDDALISGYKQLVQTGASFCIFTIKRNDSSNNTFEIYPSRISEGEVISGKTAAFYSLINWGIHANGICRTSIWKDSYEGVPLEMFDSDELISRNILLNSDLVTLSKAFYVYNINPNSSTNQPRLISSPDFIKANWLISFAQKNGFISKSQLLATLQFQMSLDILWKYINQDNPSIQGSTPKEAKKLLQYAKTLRLKSEKQVAYNFENLVALSAVSFSFAFPQTASKLINLRNLFNSKK